MNLEKTAGAFAVLVLVAAGCFAQAGEKPTMSDDESYEVTKSEAEWREELTPEEYRVLREKGTERAGSGDLLDNKADGVYVCAACDQAVFDAQTKFESGTGWPSYWKPIAPEAVDEHSDRSYGMVRTEVVCSRCGSHLGHVFEDGPEPTGLRYCINSVSLDFVPRDQVTDEMLAEARDDS